MKKTVILAIALMTLVPYSVASAFIGSGDDDATSPQPPQRSSSSTIALATYGDRTIDLRDGWGTAQACYVADSGTTCFDSENEMDEFIAASDPWNQAGLKSARLTACSSTLRLYDGISYGVPVLGISTRFTVVSLSTIGFDNKTTSYKVGACAATMWDGAAGGGTIYPGNTAAFAQSPSMVTGWNNTMSSVYLW